MTIFICSSSKTNYSFHSENFAFNFLTTERRFTSIIRHVYVSGKWQELNFVICLSSVRAVMWKYMHLLWLEDICVFLCWIYWIRRKIGKICHLCFPWTMLKVLSISSTCSLYHILLDECSKTKFFNWFSFQMIQVYLLKNFSFLFQLETIA